MYSERIIARNIERIEASITARRLREGQPGQSQPRPFRIVRFPDAVIAEMVERIDRITDKQTGKFTRDLEPVEQAFIDNELTLCQLDFRHYCERYAVIQLASQSDRPEGWDEADHDGESGPGGSGGRVGKFLLNGMQIQLLKKLARLEDLCYEAMARGVPVNGILLILHKARQLGACFTYGTKVLTGDLRWVPIETLRVGDCVMSCDESAAGQGYGRKMRLAVIVGTRSLKAPTLKITLVDGRTFTATPEHRMLFRARGGTTAVWRCLADAGSGDFIRNFGAVWGKPDYEDGWFAGLLDGEGCVRQKTHGGIELSVSQVPGFVLERAKRYLEAKGISYRNEVDRRKGSEGSSKFGNKPVHKLVVNQANRIFNLVGSTQPARFASNPAWWEGKELPNGQDLGGSWAEIASIESAGVQEVFDLQTSTGTYIAEGLVSHNSTMWQALIMHRTNFYSFVNALVASIDDKSTQALFRRGERMYDNMPAWMRAPLKRRTRTDGFVFERDSVIELQYFQQAKDLGKGETWHAVHVTEAAVADRPEDHFDEGLFAAIPFSLYTLYGMESTSKGKRGWWYDFVTNVMSGTAEGGVGRFAHYFAPFYLIDMAEEARGQRSKYRIEAPVGWQPAINTQRMLMRVKQTSHQFCDTPNLDLHRDVAYWYESTHAYFYKRGKLNIFKQNYPVDPYESFQHSTAGAFTTETIERLEGNCADYSPWPYELVTAAEVPVRNAMARALGDERLRVYDAGSYHLAPLDPAELEGDRDPRGIVWIFEQAAEQWHYVLGADPTGGIPGWQRAFRQQDDVKTDNGAVEVFRRGKPPKPCEPCAGRGWISLPDQRNVAIECRDCEGRGKLGGRAVQVAEFAAPIDAEELALYIFVLGRVFRGSSQFPECLAVVESNNTGILTIRKLQTVYEYSNLHQTQSIDSAAAPKYLSGYGFFSGPSTVPILHARSRSIIARRDVDVRSAWLVREYSDSIVKITGSTDADSASAKAVDKAIVVRERFYVPPGAGRHDDRAQASYLAYWALFDWSEDGAGSGDRDDAGPRALVPDLASRDATAAEQRQRWNDAAAQYFDADDIELGGHYADCAVECRADHGADGDDRYGFDSDDLPGDGDGDDDAFDDDGGGEWPGEGGLFGRVD